MFKGNITFFSTVRLSNNADPWNSMPISLRISFFSAIIHIGKVVAIVNDLVPVGLKQSDKAFHENGFSASAGTNDQVAFTCIDNSRHIVQDNVFVERLFLYFLLQSLSNSNAASI